MGAGREGLMGVKEHISNYAPCYCLCIAPHMKSVKKQPLMPRVAKTVGDHPKAANVLTYVTYIYLYAAYVYAIYVISLKNMRHWEHGLMFFDLMKLH